MKSIQFFFFGIFVFLSLSSFTGIINEKIEGKPTIDNDSSLIGQAENYTTWSIKVNRDCYLVLNDVDWGLVLMDNYIEVALSKGMNSLKFTKGKGGETIKKEIIVVENAATQKRTIILPGKVTINRPGEKDQKRSRRNVSKCTAYNDALSLETTAYAVVAICVNSEGYVETAEFIRSESDSLSQETIDLVVKCAKEFQYEAVLGLPTACGSITLHLGIH
jgi:hypothetical protein